MVALVCSHVEVVPLIVVTVDEISGVYVPQKEGL